MMGRHRGTGKVDWEHDLASVLEQSNKDLHNIYAEAQQQMNGSSRRRLPDDTGSRIFHDVVNTIENAAPCGPYQQAAIDAFRATRNGTRPLSRGAHIADDGRGRGVGPQQSVDGIINDKLISSSRAIDALHDQLSVLADEVRELNRSKSSQEREIGRLKEALARQQEEIATKAGVSDLKAAIEATRQHSSLSIDAAVSPLHAAMRKELNALKEDMEMQLSKGLEKHRKEASNSIQSFQRNLVDTIQGAVREECLKAVEKKAEELKQGQVKLITKIVAAAVVKLESNLKNDLLESVDSKLKGRHQQDVELITQQLKIELSQELAPIKAALKQTVQRQMLCISRKKTLELVESCRKDAAALEDRLVAAVSRNETDDSLKAMAVSLSDHSAMLKRLQSDNAANSDALSTCITQEEAKSIAQDQAIQQGDGRAAEEGVDNLIGVGECKQLKSNISAQLERFVTREEAVVIAESKATELRDLLDGQINTSDGEFDEARVMAEVASRLRRYVTKEEANAIAACVVQPKIDACEAKLAEEVSDLVINDMRRVAEDGMQSLEFRVNEAEANFGSKVERVLGVLDSFGERVQMVETSNSAVNQQLLSQLDDKAELESRLGNVEELVKDFPAKLGNIANVLFSFEQAPADARETPLRRSLATLHKTLEEAKGLTLPTLPPEQADECTPSSIVHLLGLASPGSVDSESITPAKADELNSIARTLSDAARKRGDSSLHELAAGLRARETATSGNDLLESSSPDSTAESIGTAEALSCGIKLETTGDESESPASTSVSIDTAEAMALCGMQGDENESEDDSGRGLPTGMQHGSSQPKDSPAHPTRAIAPPDNLTSADLSQQDGGPLASSRSSGVGDGTSQASLLHPSEMGDVSDNETDSSDYESVPGSITLFDEIVEVSNKVPPSDELKKSSDRTPLEKYNPTRMSNPDPYECWDVLLTELRASGRILRDGESAL